MSRIDFGLSRPISMRDVEVIPIGSNIPDSPPSYFDRDRWRAEHDIAHGTTLLGLLRIPEQHQGAGMFSCARSVFSKTGQGNTGW